MPANETAEPELRSTIQRFLDDACPPEQVRATVQDGPAIDASLWQRLATELGLVGLHAPESSGGGGGSFVELCAVVEELGSSLAPVPYRSTVQTLDVLLSLAPEAAVEEIAALATGQHTATLVIADPRHAGDPTRTTIAAVAAGNDLQLNGEASLVLDGATADALLVFARDEDHQLGLFLTAPDTEGIERASLDVLDLTRSQARLSLRRATATRLAAGLRDEQVRGAIDRLRLLVAAEALGVARRCLSSAVEYAKVRTQFDRPIGSFQAIKHDLSRVSIEVDRASAALRHALTTGTDPRFEAAVAKLTSTVAAVSAATTEIHVHGGTGFTWEHDAHLRYRRAVSLTTEFGNDRTHRELLAAEVFG